MTGDRARRQKGIEDQAFSWCDERGKGIELEHHQGRHITPRVDTMIEMVARRTNNSHHERGGLLR